jgi:hypothetical protein
MKTTTIGRIGAIVTGAAMLGTAVASALAGAVTVDANLSSGFFYDANMNPTVQVVVGEKAQASDGAAAGQIAAMIGNMAFSTETVSAPGGTKTASGGTATCTPDAAQCDVGEGSAQGAVTLSWDALGLVGELQQREMDCSIYESSMDMIELTDGGDGGSNGGDWCTSNADFDDGYVEVYTVADTVGTTLVGACATTTGADTAILKSGEFANNICVICYSFCDLALGCEPHAMYEWVEIDCDEISISYDCEEETLVLDAGTGALKYNVFTDDIVTRDLTDDESLIAQSYMGKIILGQNEYLVKDLTDSKITLACGATGTTTTSEAMMYTPPAEGSACEAADSGESYAIKLVGAQDIAETGIVDVTLEVTKPDGTTEQVNSGISGTPVIGDISVKLMRGTASSNIITGEQAFTADLLVHYLPSEMLFEDGERYDERGVHEDDLVDDEVPLWELNYNGGHPITVADLETLEDSANELLYKGGTELDAIGVSENIHYEDCYDQSSDINLSDRTAIRYLQFELQALDDELAEGRLINLPFNNVADGGYLRSDLKFGYMGLHDADFLPMSMQETTDIEVEIMDVEVYVVDEDGAEYDFLEFRTGVVLTYTDAYGDVIEARIDEGPFQRNDVILIGETPIRLGRIRYDVDDEGDDEWTVEYKLKERADWDADWSKMLLTATAFSADNWTVDSQLEDAVNVTVDYTDEVQPTGHSIPAAVDWYLDNTTNESSKVQLYFDAGGGNLVFNLTGDVNVRTEFKNKVTIVAEPAGVADWVNVTGVGQTGAEDLVAIQLDENDASGAYVYLYDDYDESDACSLKSDCRKIADGREDGTLVSLSGAIVDVDGGDEEEPNDLTDDDEDTLNAVKLTVPENEMRPTLFFGMEQTQNSSQITITDANVGQVVDIGGVPVTVEEFGVTGSVAPGTVIGGEPVTVECSPVEVTCDAVSVESKAPVSIGYKLVVVEGAQTKENLVLIGGPSVNSLTKDLTTVDELCSAAVVKLVGNKLLVAGCEAADTAAAANDLANWLKANV